MPSDPTHPVAILTLDLMKQFDLKAALLAAGLCLGLTHGAQASNEWASFMAPPLPVERNGPIADEQFALIKQGGPWHQLASNRWGQSEAHLLALLKSKQWQEASAWLKAQSPDVNAREPITGATALSLASLDGRLDLVRELIRHGAELDRVGAGGWTPLGAAAFHGHELVARDLLRKGARVDVPGASGQLPLHLACATGQTRMIELLIGQGANWRDVNRQGRHAMAESALFGQLPAMQTLQRLGANYSEPDLYGLNAVHAAALGEQRATLAYLQAQQVPVPSVITQIMMDQLAAPSP